MELKKLTKQELIDKLNEQKHLADAIEIKDNEILNAKKELENIKKEMEFAKKKIDEHMYLEQVLKDKNAHLEQSTKELEALKNESLSNKHLAKAVEEKDKEIIKLKQDLETSKHKLAESVSSVKKSYEDRIINQDLELESLREVNSNIPNVENLNNALQTLTKENTILVKVANAHLGAFRNLMKSIQGTLDNAIELEAIITESLQNKHGGIK